MKNFDNDNNNNNDNDGDNDNDDYNNDNNLVKGLNPGVKTDYESS